MWQENLRERESKGRGSFSATTYILTINGGSTAITTVSLKKTISYRMTKALYPQVHVTFIVPILED